MGTPHTGHVSGGESVSETYPQTPQGRIEKGDILITKYTDPGWTPKFGLLAGVATESGGLLSHAAVISREYGIPAVLAVEDITTLLKDGQVVTIDGNTGSVIPEGK